MDKNLNWKSHATYSAKKIKRSIGIISKLRYYVTLDTLITLYFALLYPFLIYGILIWGNTYPTNIKPLSIIQKRAIRLITFSKFDEHTSPLFKITGIYIYIYNRTMCPPGYHHNGIMAARELGQTMYGYTL